jgi:hypothetical protein
MPISNNQQIRQLPGLRFWHWLLLLSLVGLPITATLANPLMAMSDMTMHKTGQSHVQAAPAHCQQADLQQATAPADKGGAGSSCHSHSALCCIGCVPYYHVSLTSSLPFLPMVAERYQQVTVSLNHVVLKRDIRPPIV